MSASNNQSTSPSGTNTTVSTQVDKATAPVAPAAPVAPDANNTDDFDNDQLLLEFDNLDSILSDEVYLGDNVDVDMDDVSVFSSAAADPLQGIERNLKVLQRRILDLSTAIISQGQVAPPQLVTELRSLRAVLDELLEVQRLLTSVPVAPATDNSFLYKNVPRAVVPVQLSFFQWMGHVYDGTRTIFPSLKACVSKFEDVLNTYQLAFDDHWCRLLPLCLPTEIRAWLTDFTTEPPGATWEGFKSGFNTQYGITQDAEQEAATNELLTLRMSKHQTIESFINRFQDLKRRSGVVDSSVMCPWFLSALPANLKGNVTIALATAPATTKRNLSFIMSLSKELYNKLDEHSVVESASSSPSRVEKRHSSGRNRHVAQARVRDEGQASDAPSGSN
ncbi:hypothetical protein INT48_001302 [Thamnidium elegans]|uniref:Retrotransposon gag domain-containing protein n=1 Tax=Thamnidium elegans TaxID=101142 RepID=A0A8H7VXS9_9FUNG|nr:hypothetical protein INT48_001302 [Thamnidium elegans]